MPGPAAGIAAAQAAISLVQTISGDAKLKRLLSQRSAYKTPAEYMKILQATQNAAQTGFDPFTLEYLTNQTDRAFDSAAGAATRLGANPNDLAALFDQKLQASFKIGAENHSRNLANMDRFFKALDVLGQNKAAEWSSQQDILKDKMQAAAAEKAAGVQGLGSAANAFISLDSASRTQDLYKQIADAVKALQKNTSISSVGLGGVIPGKAPEESLMATMMENLGGG